MAKSRTDETVARVFSGDEPAERADVTEPPLGGGEPVPPLAEAPLTPAQAWLVEATEVRTVLSRGEPYSPGAIQALLMAAIPVVEALVAADVPTPQRRR